MLYTWIFNYSGFYLYWMYYMTQAMFQRGGNDWKNWNNLFQKHLLENQHPDGYWNSPAKGVETNRFSMADIDDKVYSTTLCALQLTVYYRYLPSSVIKKTSSNESTAKNQKVNTGEEVVDLFLKIQNRKAYVNE